MTHWHERDGTTKPPFDVAGSVGWSSGERIQHVLLEIARAVLNLHLQYDETVIHEVIVRHREHTATTMEVTIRYLARKRGEDET